MQRLLKSLYFALILLVLPIRAFSGGPFFVDQSGSGAPLTWQGNTIHWTVDSGPLNSSISNDKAIAWVKELFDIWKNVTLENEKGVQVPVVDLDVEYSGEAGYDITADNYIDYIKNNSSSKAIVIFDPDGAIIDKEFGTKAHNYVVGFATPFSNGGPYFVGGVIVLNGIFLNGASGTPKISEKEFKAAILHEIGHLLNLDHTQANNEAVDRFQSGDDSLAGEIPTMYPVLYTEEQLTPQSDDIIALAELYPSKEYTQNFCHITGNLQSTDGSGFQGADVVARATDPSFEWEDVRSFVSGVRYPAGTESGEYILGGIVPNRKYVVAYRGIDPAFTGGSSIAPYDPPKTGIVSATIEKEVIGCSKGGDTTNVKISRIAIDESNSGPTIDTASATTGDFGAAPSGGCSLIIQ